MATAFHKYPKLPLELKCEIWKNFLPSQAPRRITERLAGDIIDLTYQDDYWSRGYAKPRVHGPQQPKSTSYCQELTACAESRSVALQQVKMELENDHRISKWLKNPPYPFVPKLELDRTNGALIYRCRPVVEGYHMENIVFPDGLVVSNDSATPPTNFATPPPTSTATPTSSPQTLKKDEEEEWNSKNPTYYAEKEQDAVWSDVEE